MYENTDERSNVKVLLCSLARKHQTLDMFCVVLLHVFFPSIFLLMLTDRTTYVVRDYGFIRDSRPKHSYMNHKRFMAYEEWHICVHPSVSPPHSSRCHRYQ